MALRTQSLELLYQHHQHCRNRAGHYVLLGNTKRAKGYQTWLKNLEQEYFGNIIALEREIATVWAEMTSRAVGQGLTIGFADSWIAATAIFLDAAVVTRNVDDFKHVVVVVNPWSE